MFDMNVGCLLQVGFVVGVDGIGDFMKSIFMDAKFVCILLAALFSTVQVMFQIRDWESSKGHRLCPVM